MTLQAARKSLESFDYLLFAAVTALVTIGVIFIHSASASSGEWGQTTLPTDYAARQFQWAVISVGVFFAILVPRYSRLKSFAFAFYILCVTLLIITDFAGVARSGARRWLPIGSPRRPFALFQPSQIMEVALVLVLAKYLMFRHAAKLRDVAVVFILSGIPMLLVLKQPDLGTALLFAPLPFAMLLVSGVRIRHLAAVAACGLAAIPLFWEFVMKPYQKMRFLAWLNPSGFQDVEGWQYIQSRIAVGSGGLFGKGLGRGTQNVLNYLSERHTDFIFSVILEESGFIGGLIVIFLYLVIILCGLGIAARTREPFGRLLVVGAVSLLATQVFVNMGMNIGLMPITGLTLPFISYGGSSLLASFIAVGIMMNVAVHPVVVFDRESY